MDSFFQQLVNGLALGSIYALIALGYTMVYGVLRFINFAHSDVLMLGAFAAFYMAPAVEKIVPLPGIGGALIVILIAAMICAGIGMLIELLAYRPLRNRPKLTVLITAIGVSLFIEFTCQHKAGCGAAPRPLPTARLVSVRASTVARSAPASKVEPDAMGCARSPLLPRSEVPEAGASWQPQSG